jgi:hypothetical protein
MNISINSAILVALISAVISFVVQLFFKWYDRWNQARSFELSIIAEVEAILNILEKRDYRKGLEEGIIHSIVSENSSVDKNYKLEIQIQENYCPIYFNNLDKISFISKQKVKDVVKFYSLLMSLAQDVKSGGILSTDPSSEAYNECLRLFDEAVEIGNRIIK